MIYSDFKDSAFTAVKRASKFLTGINRIKGVLFDRKYTNTKGVPFLSKMVYERVRVGPWGGTSPYKTF